MNIKNFNEDEDVSDINLPDKYLSFAVDTHTVETIKVFLDEEIREPKYYRALIHKMHRLNETDTVILVIDSCGGQLDGAMAIIEAMENTQAKVVAVISGMAASAASIIALRAENLLVSDNARMLIHSARYGYGGKMADVRDHQKFTHKFITKVFNDSYEGFLTEDEMLGVLEGREFYLDAEEIQTRLANRDKMEVELVNVPGDTEISDEFGETKN
jgi:ATP-dependent Clp protease, protease subunit